MVHIRQSPAPLPHPPSIVCDMTAKYRGAVGEHVAQTVCKGGAKGSNREFNQEGRVLESTSRNNVLIVRNARVEFAVDESQNKVALSLFTKYSDSLCEIINLNKEPWQERQQKTNKQTPQAYLVATSKRSRVRGLVEKRPIAKWFCEQFQNPRQEGPNLVRTSRFHR